MPLLSEPDKHEFIPKQSDIASEKLPKERPGILVGKVDTIDVLRPKTLAMPLTEGTHLQVRQAGEDTPWYSQPVKLLLKNAFFALPAAKTIVHAPELPDLWANVHFNSRPFLDKGMNIYGRSPHSENGLGKPVYVREIQEEQLPGETIKKLRTAFSEVLPYWYDLFRQMNLFPDGFSPLSESSADFKEESEKYEEQGERVLLVTKKNVIVNVGNPHVQGLHLVVHSRESYWQQDGFFRGWEFPLTPKQSYQHIQGFLEMAGILLGLEQILLQDAKLPFYNPEIHFSGNWGVRKEDLFESFSGSKDEWLAHVKGEKYKQRVWAGEEWAITNHGHLYATDQKERFVRLPRRPYIERGMDWKDITPLGKEEVSVVRELMYDRLVSFIEGDIAGYVSENNTEEAPDVISASPMQTELRPAKTLKA